MLKKLAERLYGVKNRQHAYNVKRRLAILYAFLGWNCFGLAFYFMLKEKLPEDSAERRKAYSQLTGTSKNMHVYQVTGMTVKKEFQLVHDRLVQEKKQAEEEGKQIIVAT